VVLCVGLGVSGLVGLVCMLYVVSFGWVIKNVVGLYI